MANFAQVGHNVISPNSKIGTAFGNNLVPSSDSPGTNLMYDSVGLITLCFPSNISYEAFPDGPMHSLYLNISYLLH